jgi:hypothetical protein
VLYTTAIKDQECQLNKIDFWDNVYGIHQKWSLIEPVMDIVERDQINTDTCAILDISIKPVKLKDLRVFFRVQAEGEKKR